MQLKYEIVKFLTETLCLSIQFLKISKVHAQIQIHLEIERSSLKIQ